MDIKESVDRIHEADGILGRSFYAKFFQRCPDAVKFFEGVDLDRQGALLTMQLMVIMANYKYGTPAPALYLQVLGTRHKGRGIPTEMYPSFAEVLLETLAEFLHEDWDEQLKDEWRSAIEAAAAKMLEGYEQKFRV